MSNKNIQLRSHHHCVYDIKYHLVLVTKYRRKCFTKSILERLKEICTELCKKWDVRLLEFGGEVDHIHLLVECYPGLQPSKFVNNIKTVSSRYLRKEFADHLKKYYWKPVLWTRAYCLLSVGEAPVDVIRKYIENQEEPET